MFKVKLLKLWEYCLGKHNSNKTEKTGKKQRQDIRAIYAAEYTREKMEEMKPNIYQVLTFTFKI